MPYCSRCGVELDPKITECPLCRAPILHVDGPSGEQRAAAAKFPAENGPEPKNKLTPRRMRLIALEIVGIVLVLPLLITLSLDLLINKQVTWSYFSVSSILLVWFLTFFPLVAGKNWVVIVLGEICTLLGFLAALDIHDSRIEWFNVLALPLLGVIVTVVFVVTWLCVNSKNRGANIAGFVILGIGMMSMGFDLILTAYFNREFYLSWSIPILLPCLALGVFLLYAHYRIFKVIDVKKIFKI